MGILVEDGFAFGLIDREFYESLDRYEPKLDEFVSIVTRRLDADWQLERRGIWFHCRPADVPIPPHGWKIHLSSTMGNAAALLASVASLLASARVPFKFAVDRMIFRLLHGKNWSRGGSGKFVTVYPRDEEQCRDLLAALHRETIGYSGPYVLSDRRYADSAVVHYRYGGFHPTRRLTVQGDFVPTFEMRDGRRIDDARTPFFQLPEGVNDPFSRPAMPDSVTEERTLKEGRYVVESAITFTNSGGVYVGLDRDSGQKVIIKEARPHASQSIRGTDAVALLKKEHRLLQTLTGTGIAPRPIDFFRDWEHFYLVEEFLPGQVLRGFAAQWALPLIARPTVGQVKEFVARFCRVYARVAEVVQVLHLHRITFSDLSHYNVIVSEDGNVVKLIDFEGAYEQGVDAIQIIHTAGFAPQRQIEEGPQPEDDNFAVGGLMLAGLMPINGVFALNPRGFEPFLQSFVRDLGFPLAITECIRGLLDQDASRRPPLDAAIRVLKAERSVGEPGIGSYEADAEDLPSLLARIVSYVEAVSDCSRDDRLFPAAPAVFQTNPLSLAYGACGVASCLHRVKGAVHPSIVEWILKRDASPKMIPPGLYIGLAGVSWALLEIGLRERAETVIGLTEGHPLLQDSPDLFYGLAGWGMAQLRFFIETGDERYLARATDAGKRLVARRETNADTCWWTSAGTISCGLGHGSAGIALFLLYLSLATSDATYAEVGRQALDHVMSRAVGTPDGGMTWRVQEGHPTVTPYWRWGSAGIGTVLLRYAAALETSDYDAVLAGIDLDTDRKYSIFPGLHLGLAGMGEFYLDWARIRHESAALLKARKVLAGVLLFMMERDAGVAFPGETRTRISCDLATGNAGIALFIHRYLNPSLSTPFMLDELLQRASNRSPGAVGWPAPRAHTAGHGVLPTRFEPSVPPPTVVVSPGP